MAAGSGSRLGGIAKQFRLLGGVPVWHWSVRVAQALYERGRIAELVVVVPAGEDVDAFDHAYGVPTRYVAGGSERSYSVLNALRACRTSHVLIHDAARPFVTRELCEALVDCALQNGAAIPVLPVTDALKRLGDDGSVSPVDRQAIYRTQTPQAFELDVLLGYMEADSSRTYADEAEAWLHYRRDIGYVEGVEGNFKITTAEDWERARQIACASVEVRVGHGYDVHPLVPGRKLVLAGIDFSRILVKDDCRLGLLGHSDADLICHAVADALLGAAGLPDIGLLFPASEPVYKDACSADLLKEVASRTRREGWDIAHIDVTLLAQIPRIGAYTHDIECALSRLLESSGKVHFKVKSGEFVGSVGRGECMKCHSIATLTR